MAPVIKAQDVEFRDLSISGRVALRLGGVTHDGGASWLARCPCCQVSGALRLGGVTHDGGASWLARCPCCQVSGALRVADANDRAADIRRLAVKCASGCAAVDVIRILYQREAISRALAHHSLAPLGVTIDGFEKRGRK
jgi:hypothetical protein